MSQADEDAFTDTLGLTLLVALAIFLVAVTVVGTLIGGRLARRVEAQPGRGCWEVERGIHSCP